MMAAESWRTHDMRSRAAACLKPSSIQPKVSAIQANHWSLVGSLHHATGKLGASVAMAMTFLPVVSPRPRSVVAWRENACRWHPCRLLSGDYGTSRWRLCKEAKRFLMSPEGLQ